MVCDSTYISAVKSKNKSLLYIRAKLHVLRNTVLIQLLNVVSHIEKVSPLIIPPSQSVAGAEAGQ